MRRKLEASKRSAFDQEYIQAQVTDHEKTIPKFETEANQGQNPMIKNFAQNMVPVLQQHLAEARALAGGARPPRVSGRTRPSDREVRPNAEP